MEYDMYDQVIYNEIKKQMDSNATYHFGHKINIMVLSDRLMGCFNGLCEYLRQYDDIIVMKVQSLKESEKICSKAAPDIFIIVGYLANKNLYNILKTVKRANPYACTLIYAMLDECITTIKFHYRIEFAFSRHDPMTDFIGFLKEIYTQRLIDKRNGVKMISVEDIPI